MGSFKREFKKFKRLTEYKKTSSETRRRNREKLLSQLREENEKSEIRMLKRQLHKRRMAKFQPIIKVGKGAARSLKGRRGRSSGDRWGFPSTEIEPLNTSDIYGSVYGKSRRKRGKKRGKRKQRSKKRRMLW
jgi:hypothetical protein